VRKKLRLTACSGTFTLSLIQVKTLISIILWVLNAILFSAAFRHIPFGCESCASSGQTKVQRTLNRSEAEFGEANVPERLVQTLCWRSGPLSNLPCSLAKLRILYLPPNVGRSGTWRGLCVCSYLFYFVLYSVNNLLLNI